MSSTKTTPLASVSLIYSPYHTGIRDLGPGAGPSFLRSHGLAQSLRGLGLVVAEVEIEPVDDCEGEIGRNFEILRRTSKLVTRERDRGSFPVVLSGNCFATVGVAAGLSASRGFDGADLGCVWFDAHDDYNTPDTVMGGYFDSMGVAMLADECWKGLLATVPGHRPLRVADIVHVGMRDVTDTERNRVVNSGLEVIWGSKEEHVDFAQRLAQTLARKELGCTMVHVDLDCLDISLGQVNKYAAPGGLFEEDLIGCLQKIVTLTEPISITVASFDPSYGEANKIGRIAINAVKEFLACLVSKGLIATQYSYAVIDHTIPRG